MFSVCEVSTILGPRIDYCEDKDEMGIVLMKDIPTIESAEDIARNKVISLNIPLLKPDIDIINERMD